MCASSSDPLIIESSTARLEISPALGGRMTSLVVHGNEILVTGDPDPMRWGTYPMVPFAGRIRAGSFMFEGRRVQLPTNLPPDAIHGTTMTRPWTVDGPDRMSVDLGPDWPFRGRAIQRFVLGRGGLKVWLTLEADEPMPASIGWHPWLRKRLGTSAAAQLQFQADQMYERDVDGLPTGRLVDPSPGPWDDCFTGLREPPRIVWPGHLALSISSTCEDWVIYDEPVDRLCVEPQSAPPDAVNHAPRIVLPGEPLEASMTWHWWDLAEH